MCIQEVGYVCMELRSRAIASYHLPAESINTLLEPSPAISFVPISLCYYNIITSSFALISLYWYIKDHWICNCHLFILKKINKFQLPRFFKFYLLFFNVNNERVERFFVDMFLYHLVNVKTYIKFCEGFVSILCFGWSK